MRLTTFLCLILTLTAVWMQFYSAVRETFNGVSEYKKEITKLKDSNSEEHLLMALEREQFIEFRQNVASLMPGVLKDHGLGEEGYPYRSLASTITRNEG